MQTNHRFEVGFLHGFHEGKLDTSKSNVHCGLSLEIGSTKGRTTDKSGGTFTQTEEK